MFKSHTILNLVWEALWCSAWQMTTDKTFTFRRTFLKKCTTFYFHILYEWPKWKRKRYHFTAYNFRFPQNLPLSFPALGSASTSLHKTHIKSAFSFFFFFFFFFLHCPLFREGCGGSSSRLSRHTSRSSITSIISLGRSPKRFHPRSSM